MAATQTLKRIESTPPEPSTCPVGRVMARHRAHLQRELRYLGHAIDLCRSCEVAHGPCGRYHETVSEIRKAIPRALETMGLGPR